MTNCDGTAGSGACGCGWVPGAKLIRTLVGICPFARFGLINWGTCG